MSIFKDTFRPFVVRQINTRQNLLAEEKRPVDFNYYVSGKVPWIRMTSFVDYGEPGKETSDLAKKYVLMGGTLYHKKIEDKDGNVADAFYTRAGIGGRGGAYASELGNLQYGIRPMPGITGLRTKSLGAYGSLTETTIKFIAWDKKQMDELSILFLRPGYKVLVEWGWSAYLETNKHVVDDSYRSKTTSKNLYDSAKSYRVVPSSFNTINCFDAGLDQDIIYEKIDELRYRYCGNYDANLGSIKNFDFTLMPNGSFECTTVLISMADVIDTIRMNDTIGIKIPEEVSTTQTTDNTNVDGSIPGPEIKSQFELLMDEYCKLSGTYTRSNSKVIKAIDSKIPSNKLAFIDPYVYKYKEGFLGSFTDPNAQTLSGFANELNRFDQPTAISKNGQLDKRSYNYIQFGYFLHILNTYKNLFITGKDGQKVIDIEIPSSPLDPNSISNGLCQASFNSISIDPSVCLIRNSKATLFTDPEGTPGYRPQIFKTENFGNTTGNLIATSDPNIKEYLYGDTNFGTIANIYVNVQEIVSLYKQQSLANNGYVYVGQLISEILSKVSYSLGSVNDFDKFIRDNKVVIIDKHYTELPQDSSYNSKFKINVAGNNTIVRKHTIQSKIFPSQASMIAIAAQDRENIASVQTSTYNYLNKGLKDRLFGEVTNQSDDQLVDPVEAKKSVLRNLLSLIEFVNEYVMKSRVQEQYYVSTITSLNGYLNTLLVEIENGTNYKAIVPITADLTVDGISGLTIGQIFTLDKRVLPKDYESKSVGFIVTGISNEISTTSWLTSINTQMCLLDQEERQITALENAAEILRDLKEQSRKDVADTMRSIMYYKILAAIYIDVLRENIKLKNIDGDLELKQNRTIYSKTAVQESGGSEITFGDLLTEFKNTYTRIYPKKTTTSIKEVTGTSNNGRNTVTTVSTVVTEERVGWNPTDIKKLKNSEIHKYDILENIIKNMFYYTDMKNSEVKNVFDSEMSKVRTAYAKYATPPDYTKIYDPVYQKLDEIELILRNPVSNLTNVVDYGSALLTNNNAPSLTNATGRVNIQEVYQRIYNDAIQNSRFNLIDAEKSIAKTTGAYLRAVPLISGYPYFSAKF